jgi:hypothetical protein
MNKLRKTVRFITIIGAVIFLGWLLMVPDLLRVTTVWPTIGLGLLALALGTVWMVYQVITTRESPFLPMLVVSCIPFAFVWYFFARYRVAKRSE